MSPGEKAVSTERRSSKRSDLRVPLYLYPLNSSVPVETETENVGISGFFCHTNQFFSPGEHIKFLFLLLPTLVESAFGCGIGVHGEAEITRVSVDAEQMRYGIACRLCSYRILAASDKSPIDKLFAPLFDDTPTK